MMYVWKKMYICMFSTDRIPGQLCPGKPIPFLLKNLNAHAALFQTLQLVSWRNSNMLARAVEAGGPPYLFWYLCPSSGCQPWRYSGSTLCLSF